MAKTGSKKVAVAKPAPDPAVAPLTRGKADEALTLGKKTSGVFPGVPLS
jgi:hypothetical protein